MRKYNLHKYKQYKPRFTLVLSNFFYYLIDEYRDFMLGTWTNSKPQLIPADTGVRTFLTVSKTFLITEKAFITKTVNSTCVTLIFHSLIKTFFLTRPNHQYLISPEMKEIKKYKLYITSGFILLCFVFPLWCKISR